MNWRMIVLQANELMKALARRGLDLARRGLHAVYRVVLRLARLLRLPVLAARLLATGPGQYVAVRWHKAVDIYRKLTSPPPDPLMAAMMMQNVEIDIDEDPTELHGNKLFTMIGAFFVIMVLWAALTELDEVVRAEGTIVPPSSVQLVQNRLPGSVP
jgi:hypothetical protein